ncbi:TPA: chromosome segregation ATPase [Vibrio parahaemolyticus]|nr:chromosome segregation ATPase [Vibrio parahaemolyticus]HCH5090698.1 chromosome segregation ATPase [Vibrio parahaemolyticus]
MKCKRIFVSIFLFFGNAYHSYAEVEKPAMSAQLEEYVYNPRILKDVSDTLLGIDLNKNNIRDDVDKVVNHLEVTEADKEFMLRYIQYATSILSYDFAKDRLENPLIASELYKELNYINSCYKESGVDGKDLYDSINALNVLMFNTDARIIAYLHYEKYLDIRNTYELLSYDCKNKKYHQV